MKLWVYISGLLLGFGTCVGAVALLEAIEQGQDGKYEAVFLVGMMLVAGAVGVHFGDALKTLRHPPRPNDVLMKLLNDKGITAADLAFRSKISLQEMRAVLGGVGKITPTFSRRISAVLGTPPDVWSNAQKEYDARLTGSAPANKLVVARPPPEGE